MGWFIVNSNAQVNGDHEVHELYIGCSHLPQPQHQVSLGSHATCAEAVRKAKGMGYTRANGCYYCAKPCNTG
jgi:hypothetical protein